MLVNERVVFLPEKPADAGRTGEHLRRDDHQPGNAEAETKSGEHVRQGGRDQHLEECLGARKFEDVCNLNLLTDSYPLS